MKDKKDKEAFQTYLNKFFGRDAAEEEGLDVADVLENMLDDIRNQEVVDAMESAFLAGVKFGRKSKGE